MAKPVRTCVGCRRKMEKDQLARFVLEDGEPVEDRQGDLPGRGAYLCRDEDCLDKALKSGALARSLRIQDGRRRDSRARPRS